LGLEQPKTTVFEFLNRHEVCNYFIEQVETKFYNRITANVDLPFYFTETVEMIAS